LAVFVLDKRKKPLMSCCEKRARLLLTHGRAVVRPRHPLTMGLKDRVEGDVWRVRVNVNPGGTPTGLAILTEEDGNKPAKALHLFELAHPGRRGRLG
jgi:RRXRR protein